MLFFILACGEAEDTAAGSCAERDPSDCGDCATIDGRLFTDIADTGGACVELGEPEALACRDADLGCTEAEVWRRAPGGECYWFHDGCVPAGFTEDCDPQTTADICP